ncbi:CLUMA_CG018988, isoform A [Clunio marinus]|uniref:CLUMA_CG018988, isoform A n=1 Tax=Clunio marinus TaxID=568069 RepID=A0A1J1J414_9DIPT|nr:CLUMA_CG018988, isoform A [Clunio marinus]
MKVLLLIILSTFASEIASDHGPHEPEKCCTIVSSCLYKRNGELKVAKLDECPVAPCCGLNQDLVTRGEKCCCEGDNSYYLDRPDPDSPGPENLGMCITNESGLVTGGYSDPCPSVSTCAVNYVMAYGINPNTGLTDKCCCVAKDDKDSIHFD